MKGKDGLVCAAKIRTAQGRTNCPIAKLITLEVSSDVVSSSSDANTVLLYYQMVPMEIQLEVAVNHDDKQQRKGEDVGQATWWAPGRCHRLANHISEVTD